MPRRGNREISENSGDNVRLFNSLDCMEPFKLNIHIRIDSTDPISQKIGTTPFSTRRASSPRIDLSAMGIISNPLLNSNNQSVIVIFLMLSKITQP